MRCHNQPSLGPGNTCGLLGRVGCGDRALSVLLPEPCICCLSFHSLPVCGSFFLSPSEGPAFACPVKCSLAQPTLGKPPPSQNGLLHACLSSCFGLNAQVVATLESCIPTATGILPAALGPASVGLWGLGGPLRPFSTFCGTSDASKTVSPPRLGVRARRVLSIADHLPYQEP